MTFIVVVTVIMLIVLIGWTWNNLGGIANNKKIIYIISSIAIVGLITFVIFTISKVNVEYSNKEMIRPIGALLTAIFTSINGYIVIQYIARIINLIDQNAIDKIVAVRRIRRILIIFLLVAILEVFYLKDIQSRNTRKD